MSRAKISSATTGGARTLLFLLTAGVGIATGGAARGGPVLHEFVPLPGKASPHSPGETPGTIQVGDRTLPRPSADARPSAGERIIQGTPGQDRRTRIRPDRSTGADDVLRYRAEFNPSVVPFKRMTALDAVGKDYEMGVVDRKLRLVEPSRVPSSPDRERFWGSLMLNATPGRAMPIPSVAPSARILSYQTTPRSHLRFFKDSADNFWIRTSSRGPLRLVFLTDAPRSYFSPQIPTAVTTRDIPAHLRPRLPAAVVKDARRVIQNLGIKRGATMWRQLERLTTYFRNFKPGRLPQKTGNTYLDIALSQTGVCRHRSFAFVVTAQALGIPARYVQNEAHAFTEVFVPRLGWIRIDLGGASPELRVQNGQKKAIHNPGPDPFPRPTPYTASYSGLDRSVSGIKPEQRMKPRRARVSLRSYDRSRRRGASAAHAGAAALRSGAGPGPAVSSPDGVDGLRGEQRAGGPAAPRKRATRISLSSPTPRKNIYRGERLSISGRVTNSRGGGIEGLRVDIFLSVDGRVSTGPKLGVAVSGPGGHFRASLPVPRDLQVGKYKIYAGTPGDAAHEKSRNH